MRKAKFKIGFAAILFLVIAFSITHSPEIEAETPPFEKYDNYELRLDEVVELYHKTINDQFNERIKSLLDELDDPNIVTQSGPCIEKDTRTYCLAMEALKEYEGYVKALIKRREKYEDTGEFCEEEEYERLVEESKQILDDPTKSDKKKAEAESALKQLGELKSPFITKQMGASLKRIEFIDNEIEVAGIALDKSLAFYNELRMAYPIHKQNQKLIKNLEEFNKKLAEIRKNIETLPGKFIDASTTKCT